MAEAHLDLDDDVGGGAFLVEPTLQSCQGTTHDHDLLVKHKVVRREGYGVARLAQHILQLPHLVLGDEGEGMVAVLVRPGRLVHLETVDGGVCQQNRHQVLTFRADEHPAGQEHPLHLTPVAALVDMGLHLACHIYLIAGTLEHGPDGALTGGLALGDVPPGDSDGKARALMRFGWTLAGGLGYCCFLCHLVYVT